ncbi:MAG TPA: radical SAM protein [Vicinamibacterales bacterium]|nr:radical SAM protein [Vicinamibacterales bacterium]HPW20172.1 radical SAM protein [Vicinamibacterales bacterium]
MSTLRRLSRGARARLRAVPAISRWHARLRSRAYERTVQAFTRDGSGRANRFPAGIVYEATMRCNLRCEFCYVGDLLNIEGEWRQELPLEAIRRAFPARSGLQVNLTGGEIFMRKDIMEVLDLFARKRYVCGYLTTNGTIIDDARADALAELARRGFLRHISVSVDGPGALHDAARGVRGTFERTAAGLRRLQAAAARRSAPLRLSINTTVAAETLGSLHLMADVAREFGVDAIGLNHLMFATPEEAEQTAKIVGAPDGSAIATFVTPDPSLASADVARQVQRLQGLCREKGLFFDFRPKVWPSIVQHYYTPGAPLLGRCLYPFLHARVGFSGKVYFCPFIRIEVGDLSTSTIEDVWNSPRYVELRRLLLERKLFPVCRRCCKVELSKDPVPGLGAPAARRRTIPLTTIR